MLFAELKICGIEPAFRLSMIVPVLEAKFMGLLVQDGKRHTIASVTGHLLP